MKKLYVITQTFPVDKGEDTFIGPEAPFLKKEFDTVFVPLERCDFSIFDKTISAIKAVFKPRLYAQIIKNKHKANSFFKLAAYSFFVEWRATIYASYLDKNIFIKAENAIVYSYWYNEICLAGLSLKNKYPNYKFITRTHRYDLYDQQSPSNVQPYKEYMDTRLDRISFISREGKQYYLNRYNLQDSEKYTVDYLGVKEEKPPYYNPDTQNELKIISCSHAVAVKRIEAIIEALSLIQEIEISWTYVGAGSELAKLTELAKKMLDGKKNISYNFKGYLKNKEYMEFLTQISPHMFLTTSYSEGLPVTLMEACSVKLPCIATDVGGISEIVSEKNGTLMPANPTPQQVATAISDFYHLSSQEKSEKSDNSYKIWQEKFNSETNSQRFVQLLKGI